MIGLKEYGIVNVWNMEASVDYLFSCSEMDPMFWAQSDGSTLALDKRDNQLPFDVTAAIGPNGTVITQILVFEDSDAHAEYISRGITIFWNLTEL